LLAPAFSPHSAAQWQLPPLRSAPRGEVFRELPETAGLTSPEVDSSR